MSKMHTRSDSVPSRTSLAIVLAFIITGCVVVIVAVLLAMCYVTNNRRKKAQREQTGIEMNSSGHAGEMQGKEGAKVEGDSMGKAS
jgi:heme/copper-type cytochrome/quinol oxidase subunit 2